MEVLKDEIKNEQDFFNTIAQLHETANLAHKLLIELFSFEPSDMSSVNKEYFSVFEDNFFEKITEIDNLSGIVFNYLREKSR